MSDQPVRGNIGIATRVDRRDRHGIVEHPLVVFPKPVVAILHAAADITKTEANYAIRLRFG